MDLVGENIYLFLVIIILLLVLVLELEIVKKSKLLGII